MHPATAPARLLLLLVVLLTKLPSRYSNKSRSDCCVISMITLAMFFSPYQTTVHVEPLGTVTTIPLLIVTGPAVMAFLPEVIV